MFRKYIVVNETFGNVCFNGRRFFTPNGANRYFLRKVPPMFRSFGEYTIRKVL